MPTIDPTSTIDPLAEVADDVEIGPYCIIRGKVRIGAGTRLVSHVQLKGPLTLGERNLIYPFACLGFAPQTRRTTPDDESGCTVIGDDNIFRESVTIHRSTGHHPTTVGHRNYMMVNSHLGHDVVMGNDCTLANDALIAGHVEIADRVMIGGNGCVHQFCRIGRLAMISGLAAVVKDLPPFCTVIDLRRVSALNLVGLRRAGYQQNIDNLRKAFSIIFRQGHTNPHIVSLLERDFKHDPLCVEMTQFIASTKRGITPYGSSDDIDNVRGKSSREDDDRDND
ncbi:MAG: acyl-ACP--UDP-N-acetylglucosamine O-acyltransferase [Phycisphaeraceae bacterium]|nr:acyl-ACP--UDP-N-acetylglucosamine O-acyltransferase [Phycisphaeraceae bacterium]